MSETVNTPTDSHWYPAPAISDADLTEKVKEEIAKDTIKLPPSSATQPCPLAEAKAKKEAQNETCTFTGVKVSKPNRGFDLIVNAATPANQRTIGIVAGFKNKPAKVIIDLQGPVGPCLETHNQKRSFNTGSSTFKILPASTENKLELEITSSTKIKLFPWGLTPNKYTISSNRCGYTNESVTIEAYPDTEIDVYIGFNFSEKKIRGGKGKKNKTDDKVEVEQKLETTTTEEKSTEVEMGSIVEDELEYNSDMVEIEQKLETTDTEEKSTEVEMGLRVGGEVKYDGQRHKIEVLFKKTIETFKKISKVVNKAKDSLKKIKGNVDKIKKTKGMIEADTATQILDSPVALGIKFPVVDLHVGGLWKEDSGLPTVSYEGKIRLVANPLLGLFFEWNITSTVMQAIPGGFILQKIKKRFEIGFLDLILRAGVNISGEIELTIKNIEIENVTGKIQGKIPITAELIVLKIDFDVWIIHATIEYKVGVESGFEIEISYVPNVKELNCAGGMLDLVIWWSGSYSFGSALSDTENNKYGTTSKTGPEVRHELYKKTFESKYEFFTYDFKKL